MTLAACDLHLSHAEDLGSTDFVEVDFDVDFVVVGVVDGALEVADRVVGVLVMVVEGAARFFSVAHCGG